MRIWRITNRIMVIALIVLVMAGAGCTDVWMLRSGINHSPVVQDAIIQGQSILPPDEVQKSHPLVKQIESVMQRQDGAGGFVPTGLKKDDYLRIVDGQVKAMRGRCCLC